MGAINYKTIKIIYSFLEMTLEAKKHEAYVNAKEIVKNRPI